MPDGMPERPQMFGRDREYWLRCCEGFQLMSDGRNLGIVAELRHRSRNDVPDALVAHGGVFGNRVTVVPVDQVLEIDPGQMRITASNVSRARSRQRLAWLRAALSQLRPSVPAH